MKKIYFVLALLCFFSLSTFAQVSHTVNSGSYYYTPSNFAINIGDTVIWLNDGGLHNVNFDVSVITGNSFGNPESFSSSPTTGPVLYTHVFNIPGSYNYDCSVGSHALNGMVGSLTVQSLNTYIPDTNFENYLEANGMGDGIALNNSVFTSNINSVTTLDVSNLSISDLTGIEDFLALQSLHCSYNQLTNLDISNNTALTHLDCSDNQLTTLDVSNNLLLSGLYCWNNQLTTLDVSTNVLLYNLEFGFNQLTTIDISSNVNLFGIYCNDNLLSSLDVSNNINLDNIVCSNNSITNLYLLNNSSIRYLECDRNQLTSLNLSNNTVLEQLHCGSNQITNLDVSSNPLLTYLNAENNQLSSLDVNINIALTNLYVNDNQISSLDLNSNTALVYLYFHHNQIPAIDLSSNINLKWVYCYNNLLTNLDLSSNINLELFNCNNNLLNNLDVSSSVNLWFFDCSYNQISTLDVSSNINLEEFSFGNNLLTSLDVSSNINLKKIFGDYNQFTSLDFSNNTLLEYLHIYDNQLNFLDLRNGNNTNLYQFIANNNPNLNCISVDDSTYSTNNWPNPWVLLDSHVVFSNDCYLLNPPNPNVSIDSLVIINDINCNGDLADISIYTNNPSASIYQSKGFLQSGLNTTITFSTSNTSGTILPVNGLFEGSYYILLVDSVAFANAFPVQFFSPLFGPSWSTVINHPSVYDYDSIVLNSPTQLVNNFNTQSNNLCFGDCIASEMISISGGVAPYSLNGSLLLSTDTLLNNLCVGSYSVLISDANGCQVSNLSSSFIITEPPAIISNDSVTTCGSYTWNGIAYNGSGTYSSISIAANGCDSTAFLHLIIIPCYGCTDSTAVNFDPLATVDDGSCSYDIFGCTDSSALNYDSLATVDDGSCFYGNCQYLAPINNFVTNITDTRATINWNNLNSNNCMVLKYVIRYRELGTNTWTTKSGGAGNGSCNFGLNSTSKEIMSLSPSTIYQYKIKAYYCSGGVSIWTLPNNFTTKDACAPISNLSAQTYNGNPSKVTFSWDTTGTYVFARIALRVNNAGSSWQTAGGFGIYYPTLFVNKFGLFSGTDYRAQGRTFCDSSITSYRSSWTAPIFWTQPNNRLIGGEVIKNLQVYPNPSRNNFNISFVSKNIQTFKIRIINVIGEIFYKEDLHEFVGEYTKNIDLSKFEKSIYLLEIQTGEDVINKKLILQ